ncbi:uncharacterized protein LOC131161857 isoform X2 [Malania oleifera]|uniref:uncharacterized protein LOC131161857 isoform X2 n=1 Tax=Malania oleifera TaxID=397392 RepID=UPI0025AE2227|nr:uncharacterized protein LOC131161857 isoform X2 [Malania oleifera]XP_057973870.1 uncharacterized protein LOC131161857 isoform X2 [Malania oleifera]
MVRPKAPSKKQQKHGVDFKKIKRKIGRKLPPPKNVTNTEIKSKAIILPEQRVASEKAGLAVSKKGLTLKELLQQTSHHNPKVRRDALMGIKDLLLKYPMELKLHKYAVIEKLRERISDDDKVVRETLYQLFKTVIFPSCKEDNQGPLISLMMAYIFNAMTHLAIDVRLMAFKFLDLVVLHHPPSFSLHAEKILENYENILRKNQFYLQDKSKLKNAIAGLMRCLSLLPCNKGEVDTSCGKDTTSKRILHAFEPDVQKDFVGFSVIVRKLMDLMPVLVNCFHEFIPFIHAAQLLDAQSFDCMLYILQSLDLGVRFFVYGVDNCQLEQQIIAHEGHVLMSAQTISPIFFKKLFGVFPLNPGHPLSEKDDDRYFILNIVITEIFLQLSECMFPPAILLEKFLAFVENALSGKITSAKQSGRPRHEKQVLSLLSFLPKLLSRVQSDWRPRLLQAFTKAFMDCKPESSLKLACLSTIEEMLLPGEGMLFLDASDSEILNQKISWIRELPLLLIQLGDTHPSYSKAVLHLLLRLGHRALLNSSLMQEYDNMQYLLSEFYGTFPDERTICYGPFIRLPRDSQELSICCLYYFSFLDAVLLKSLASCCLYHDLEPSILFRIVEVLHSSYKAGHIQIADHISFFITLLSRFKVFPENIYPSMNSDDKISNHGTFKSVTSVVCSFLSQMGDDSCVSRILEKVILDQISHKLPLDNTCALLRMLIVLDFRPTRVFEPNIINLSNSILGYLMDAAYCIQEDEDESTVSMSIRTCRYYLVPCFFLFDRSHQLLKLVLDNMVSVIAENSLSTIGHYKTDNSIRINAIVSVLLWMFKDVKLQWTLSSCKVEIDRILQKILSVQSSKGKNMAIEEGQKIQCAYDRLKIVATALPSGLQII